VERKGVVLARRIIVAVSVLFALVLIAYGVAINMSVHAAIGAWVSAYQRDDPNVADLGPRTHMFAKHSDGERISKDEQLMSCLQRTPTWTIEDPEWFTLGQSCATLKATCEGTAHYSAAWLERRASFRWYISNIEAGRCK
jgi:hypothetical protein